MKFNKKLEKMLVEYDETEKFEELNDATKYLLRFYYNSKSKDNISCELIIDNIVWEKDFEDFNKALFDNDVHKIIFASTWSSAINLLMFLIEKGYKVMGTDIYCDREIWNNHREVKKGIVLER